eukprot:CAMPEP_0206584962 /NCGR_PEP_ID=MMETSP0325_2-20121206/36104_1 /ASSEMBLY_ACC=CAM_ASM_000347 /TAXON_ID=2866 /ORGANISM="Crypthecodinium cohnii, Strain Seligo" /LENGTH=109 /DNA_ID=CAMNT_0054092359 /DNA_START=291 /DNA_END=617 /DNA_ORIENTATION=+
MSDLGCSWRIETRLAGSLALGLLMSWLSSSAAAVKGSSAIQPGMAACCRHDLRMVSCFNILQWPLGHLGGIVLAEKLPNFLVLCSHAIAALSPQSHSGRSASASCSAAA